MASLTCLRYAEATAIIPLMSHVPKLLSTVCSNVVRKLEPSAAAMLQMPVCCKTFSFIAVMLSCSEHGHDTHRHLCPKFDLTPDNFKPSILPFCSDQSQMPSCKISTHHLLLDEFCQKMQLLVLERLEKNLFIRPKQLSNALLQLPKFDNIHTLSVSRSAINAITFNKAGDWVALGCAALGQLLVWEWRSESYILKQQGHYYDIATSAFSPDGQNLATGADDSKVSASDHSNQSHAVVHLDVPTMVLMPSKVLIRP